MAAAAAEDNTGRQSVSREQLFALVDQQSVFDLLKPAGERKTSCDCGNSYHHLHRTNHYLPGRPAKVQPPTYIASPGRDGFAPIAPEVCQKQGRTIATIDLSQVLRDCGIIDKNGAPLVLQDDNHDTHENPENDHYDTTLNQYLGGDNDLEAVEAQVVPVDIGLDDTPPSSTLNTPECNPDDIQ